MPSLNGTGRGMGAMSVSYTHLLIPVLIAERIKCFIDAVRQETGDELCLHAIQADGSGLIELGRLLPLVLCLLYTSRCV